MRPYCHREKPMYRIIEGVQVVPDGDQYEWRCYNFSDCEPILDQHGRACETWNNAARREFYATVAASEVAELVEELLS